MLRDARYAHLAAALALLVGLMAAVAGLLRLGFVADLLSRPVLVGYMADAGSGLLRGFPVSSSATRTAIAVATGARSQLYSVITAVTVITALLFARPVLVRFPTAALGAIAIYAALRLIDVTAFRRLLAFRRTELAIALAACIGVLAFNILYGSWSRSHCPLPTC